MQTDPVCGMKIEPERAAARADYKGATYYFCSPGCHKAFSGNPEKYLAKAAAGHGAGHAHHP